MTKGDEWPISSQITGNLYAQHTLPMASGKDNDHLRLGLRNIANTAPPLSSSGYSGAMCNLYGRDFYANFKVDFQARNGRDGSMGRPAPL